MSREQYHKNRLQPEELELMNKLWSSIKDLKPETRHHLLYALLSKKAFRPMAVGFANFKDQLLHVFYPIIVFGLFSYGLICTDVSAYLFAALAGLLIGLIREAEQFFGKDLRIPMLRDRLLDISMFTLGSLILMFFIQAYFINV